MSNRKKEVVIFVFLVEKYNEPAQRKRGKKILDDIGYSKNSVYRIAKREKIGSFRD